ncbi:hypothetical protein M0805_004832 [Coniferiporia weirii]|nr:hypothetical protein M0805_004832 [Coniferiporia weirii]
MSSFAVNHVRSLVSTASSVDDKPEASVSRSRQSSQGEELHSLLLQLSSPFDKHALHGTLRTLGDREGSDAPLTQPVQDENNNIRDTLENRIIVGVYAEVLDLWLKEASEADSEAEWWAGTARSRQSVAWYLLASKLSLGESLRR